MTVINETVKGGLNRRYGIAKIAGSVYFDYEQLAIELRRKVGSPLLDWEVPISPKDCHVFASDPAVQKTAINVLQEFFAQTPEIFFHTAIVDAGKCLKHEVTFIAGEDIFDWVQPRLEEGKIPDLVIWSKTSKFGNPSRLFKTYSKRLADVCIKVRLLEISLP